MSDSLHEIGKMLAAAVERGEPFALTAEQAAAMLYAMTTGEPELEPVKLTNGDLENFIVRVDGKAIRCPHGCGCNVFHKPDRTRLDLYQCNSCDGRFEGE